MGFYGAIPLFLDTNLGTHFALSVSQDVTAGELKGKLGTEHLSCFPNLRKIKIHALMVKKKSFFYHLSDSTAIKHVFEGVSKTWILHLNASWDENQNQKSVNPNIKECKRSSPISDEQADIHSSIAFYRKNETKAHNLVETVGFTEKEEVKPTSKLNITKCESAEAISVTGIISRFFADLDEAESCYCLPNHPVETELVTNNPIHSTTGTMLSQPDHRNYGEIVESNADTQCSIAKLNDENAGKRVKSVSKVQRRASKKLSKQSLLGCIETSSSKFSKHQVGKKLVQAASCMQTSGSRKWSGGLFRSTCRKLIRPDFDLLINKIAFDGDDFVE